MIPLPNSFCFDKWWSRKCVFFFWIFWLSQNTNTKRTHNTKLKNYLMFNGSERTDSSNRAAIHLCTTHLHFCLTVPVEVCEPSGKSNAKSGIRHEMLIGKKKSLVQIHNLKRESTPSPIKSTTGCSTRNNNMFNYLRIKVDLKHWENCFFFFI